MFEQTPKSIKNSILWKEAKKKKKLWKTIEVLFLPNLHVRQEVFILIFDLQVKKNLNLNHFNFIMCK